MWESVLSEIIKQVLFILNHLLLVKRPPDTLVDEQTLLMGLKTIGVKEAQPRAFTDAHPIGHCLATRWLQCLL